MIKQFVFCGTFIVLIVLSNFFVKANKSNVELNKSWEVVTTDRKYLLHYTRTVEANLEKEFKNSPLPRETSTDKKRHRKIRRKKEKESKADQPKNKVTKAVDYIDEQIQRNNEKLLLVRNRTIEILKNGLRILNTGESHIPANKKPIPRLHENLLKKILSSATPKQEMLYSGTNKVTVGGKAFDPKLQPQTKDDLSAKRAVTVGITPTHTFPNEKGPIHLAQTQSQDGSFKETYKNYDYDEYESTVEFRSNDLNKSQEAFLDYGPISFDGKVRVLLERIVEALKNITTCSSDTCFKGDHDKDPCLKWLDCKESLNQAFVGENDYLPSCPCTYPSTIFYDDAIRDEKHKKYFRWRDASSEAERLDVYKPGAAYCIRSLVTRGSSSLSSQQCCYDGKLLLLTRGSGAGTINFVSPDVSQKLHYIADILPWRLCKGDFTRYNEARTPNNGNNCPENPEQKQYRLQVQYSKNF